MPLYRNVPALSLPLQAPQEPWPLNFDSGPHLTEALERLQSSTRFPNGGEIIQCSVYDTWKLSPSGEGTWVFFQLPGDRGLEWTNVQTPGCLTFPKALSGRDLLVQSDQELPCGLRVEFMIGAEMHHQETCGHIPSATSALRIPTTPYYVPTVENFNVLVRWPKGGPPLPAAPHLRVTLPTYLLRDKQ